VHLSDNTGFVFDQEVVMDKRRFGRTGHMSTVAIFGAAAFFDVTQTTADRAMAQVIQAGINHIDVAPSYGLAEERLQPWLKTMADDFFLGCKTMERGKIGAAAELRRSLERLGVDRFDLYQLHAVDSMDELDKATAPGGALEAVLEAKEEGLLDYIGITGHGLQVADVFLEAMARFDFDSVLLPVNFTMYANPAYRASTETLLAQCQERDVGVMAIKAVARALWHDRPKTHSSWYEPFDRLEEVEPAVRFSLSQPVSGLCTVSDVKVLPLFLRACERYEGPMATEEQEALIDTADRYEPIFNPAHPTL
jgi:aryl-alcohol dehydrogenase-like predicted oxidoreductase